MALQWRASWVLRVVASLLFLFFLGGELLVMNGRPVSQWSLDSTLFGLFAALQLASLTTYRSNLLYAFEVLETRQQDDSGAP
jgi:hypothetical protein